MLYSLLLVTHCFLALFLVALVLLQPSRGTDMMASNSGASQTLFGSQGATSFISKLTAITALLFFATSLSLHHLTSRQQNTDHSIVTAAEAASQQ